MFKTVEQLLVSFINGEKQLDSLRLLMTLDKLFSLKPIF